MPTQIDVFSEDHILAP